MGKKLDIGFVTDPCCIRVVKEAIALRLLGHRVHLLAVTPRSTKCFTSVHQYGNARSLETSVKLMSQNIDIWHVHNEPTWPVVVVRNADPLKKIILDYHDSNYWRTVRERVEGIVEERMHWYVEDTAVGMVDGIVVPSPSCAEETATRFKGPIIDLPPACPLSEYRYFENEYMGGLVSQGGHCVSNEYKLDNPEHWRDYTELYSALKGKIQVFAYSPSFTYDPQSEIDKHYLSLGVKLGKLSYNELMDALSRHSWNLVGNIVKVPVWKYATPNKFFDAVAAGVPSAVFNCPEAAKYVEKYDIGIVCEKPEDLVKRWEEHVQKRINLWKMRHELCMENFIGRVEQLYYKLLGGENEG